jgi:17beta-estradiol 17-dehydrogenase / very-long-chain 3-oxoacyl-CoA reductase
MAGEVPTPLLSEYSAAKSYVSSFSKALNAEYKGKGVHIQCQGTYSRTHFLTFLLTHSLIVPLFVATNMSKIRKTSLFVPGPETYAKAAVNAIGYDTVISPYWYSLTNSLTI